MFRKIALMTALTTVPVLAAANTRPAATSQRVLFSQLAQQCGKDVHPDTLQAVARVESQFNPYAIGVVKGALPRQPRSMAEAVEAAKMLHAQGRNFSMGLMQVNRYNLKSYGLDYRTVCRSRNPPTTPKPRSSHESKSTTAVRSRQSHATLEIYPSCPRL